MLDTQETVADDAITAATDAKALISDLDTSAANQTLTDAEAAGLTAVAEANQYVTDATAPVAGQQIQFYRRKRQRMQRIL